MAGPIMERVSTGINGLDTLLNGGIPEEHTVLLAGPAGSGKTSFCLEFLYRGATEHDENGVYISFEETEDDVIRNLPFEWDLEGVIEDGGIEVVNYDPYQYDDIVDLVRTTIKQNDAKRVVIDSITAMSLYVENVKDVRKLIMDINEELKQQGTTAIFTGEINADSPEEISRFGVEAFLADGVITLMLGKEGAELTNKILVRKMRGTDHDKQIHPFAYEETGMHVYADETAIESGDSGGEDDLF